MGDLPATAALVIVDVQQGFDAPYWGPRNNLDAEANIARLLARWRETGRPIYHIRHDSTDADSSYRPELPGNAFKPEVAPLAGETVVGKQTNSAFIGTDLEARLRKAGHELLIVTGVITNNSVEATVRMAGNLGFETYLVADATATVDKPDLDGRLWLAEDVHALALANMDGEYATVVLTDEVLART